MNTIADNGHDILTVKLKSNMVWVDHTGKPRPEVVEAPLGNCDSSHGRIEIKCSTAQKYTKVGRFGDQGSRQ